jgi:hypothetical protein
MALMANDNERAVESVNSKILDNIFMMHTSWNVVVIRLANKKCLSFPGKIHDCHAPKHLRVAITFWCFLFKALIVCE